MIRKRFAAAAAALVLGYSAAQASVCEGDPPPPATKAQAKSYDFPNPIIGELDLIPVGLSVTTTQFGGGWNNVPLGTQDSPPCASSTSPVTRFTEVKGNFLIERQKLNNVLQLNRFEKDPSTEPDVVRLKIDKARFGKIIRSALRIKETESRETKAGWWSGLVDSGRDIVSKVKRLLFSADAQGIATQSDTMQTASLQNSACLDDENNIKFAFNGNPNATVMENGKAYYPVTMTSGTGGGISLSELNALYQAGCSLHLNAAKHPQEKFPVKTAAQTRPSVSKPQYAARSSARTAPVQAVNAPAKAASGAPIVTTALKLGPQASPPVKPFAASSPAVLEKFLKARAPAFPEKAKPVTGVAKPVLAGAKPKLQTDQPKQRTAAVLASATKTKGEQRPAAGPQKAASPASKMAMVSGKQTVKPAVEKGVGQKRAAAAGPQKSATPPSAKVAPAAPKKDLGGEKAAKLAKAPVAKPPVVNKPAAAPPKPIVQNKNGGPARRSAPAV